MNLRWIKKYSVCYANPAKTDGARILRQEMVLQTQNEKGVWTDIPVVNDIEGYKKAKEALANVKAPWTKNLSNDEQDAIHRVINDEED